MNLTLKPVGSTRTWSKLTSKFFRPVHLTPGRFLPFHIKVRIVVGATEAATRTGP